MVGIYCIQNKINYKVYVGQSWDIKERFTEHKRLLNKNEHPNRYLQFAWNKYGCEKFEFFVVCDLSFILEMDKEIAQKILDDAEILWIDYFGGKNSSNTYNFKSGGSRGKYSDEYRKWLSEQRKGKFAGKKNSMYGRHHTQETKDKISKNRKGKCVGEKNHRYGKPLSEEQKQRLIGGNIGRVQSDDEKAKKSATMKELWSDPEFAQKQRQSHKNAHLKQRKYSDDFVIMIREEYANTKISITKLANKYSIPRSLCQNILEHKGRFKDIP